MSSSTDFQFGRLMAVEDALANGAERGDDPECHPMYPVAVAARQVLQEEVAKLEAAAVKAVPMLLFCPLCGERHIDEGEFATKLHHTHACQHCGMVWRPALLPTFGVQFLPGFKNTASGMSAGTAETQSGSGLQPASPVANEAQRDAPNQPGEPNA